jgi:hypothetical protein
MMIDLTITGPGMFSLKDLFDLSQELDVRIETKIMFAFHPDIMFTPLSWPRDILNEMIDELLAYMEPKSTDKQRTLVDTLKSMKDRQTHEEAFPDTYKTAALNGKNWLKRLEEIRKDTYTIEDIYSENKNLSDWWNNI